MRIKPLFVEKIVKIILWVITGMTIAILFWIVAYILLKGSSVIDLEFLFSEAKNMGREGGILPFILSIIYVTSIALIFAVPLGIGAATYLAEYVREGTLSKVIRFGVECLVGIPSIIFGLFGLIFFVTFLGFGWSVLSGGLTETLMMLPFIISSGEEAIKSVPEEYRKVSYSLGETKWRTITRVVLPNALPGIITGIILSIGKCVGETASLIFTAGSTLRTPLTVFDSGRTLAVHFYILAREGLSMEKAYGVAAVLIISILGINFLAYFLMRRFAKRSA